MVEMSEVRGVVCIAAILVILSFPALAEKVLLVDLTINANDTVALDDVLLVTGKPTAYAEGDYEAQLLDSGGKLVDSQRMPVEFFISGMGEVNTTLAEARFANYEGADKMRVLKGNVTIFESPIVLCNGNGACDNNENYLSCPKDCPSASADKYCDRAKDGRCDPDCASEADDDCQSASAPAGSNWIIYGLAAVGVVAIVLLVTFLLKRKPAEEAVVQQESAVQEQLGSTGAAKSTEPVGETQTDEKAQIIEWARKQLAEGRTREQIRDELLKYECPTAIVEEVLRSI